MQKYGYDGLIGIIPAAESIRFIRVDSPNPLNSWSILRLLKNGRDAENRAVIRADTRAETFADLRAVACAVVRAVVRADTFVENQAGISANLM